MTIMSPNKNILSPVSILYGKGAVILALLAGVTLSILLYITVQDWEQALRQNEFEKWSASYVTNLQKELDRHLDVIESIAAFYASSVQVERQEFHNFTQTALVRHPGIQALEWIPKVRDSDRQLYESMAHDDGFENFQITEQRIQGEMISAVRRQEYYPVYFVEPYQGNELALGFDLASNPVRLDAMEKARDSGRMIATARITLVQESTSQFGFLIFQPIYRNDATVDTLQSRRNNLQGYSLGVFRIGEIVKTSLDIHGNNLFSVALVDETAPASEQLLYTSDKLDVLPHENNWHEKIFIPGREWSLYLTPKPGLYSQFSMRQSSATLSAGLLFTTLLAWYLYISSRRISHIERLMLERIQVEEALSDSQQKLMLHVQQTPLGVIEWDLNCQVKEWNPGAERIFGYTRADALGRHAAGLIVPESVEEEVDAVWQVLLVQKGSQHNINENNTKNGDIRICGWYNTSLIDKDNRVIGVASLVEDITERRHAEEELQKYRENLEELVAERTVELAAARDRAEESDRLKSTFLAVMSHELRTPLNSIIGFTGIILQGMAGPLTEEQDKQLSMVQGSARHLLDLINDVLDISMIEAGEIDVVPKDFDVREAINKAVQKLIPLANEKGLALSVDIAQEVGFLMSDQRRFEQILINLLNNAVKFSEVGEVHIECRISKDQLMTCVKDTGIGVKPEDLDKLFKEFRQLDSGLDRKQEGSGLGLSICKKLVNILGGDIWAESKIGEGSVFTFMLPMKTGE